MSDTKREATKKAQTVLGLVHPDDLGITLPHEHLLLDGEIWFVEPKEAELKKMAFEPVGLENISWIMYNQYNNLDNLRLLDEDLAIKEAMLFKKEGGGTIVDVTSASFFRDLPALKRISLATGLNIIIGSGYYVVTGSAGQDLDGKTEDEIAEEIVTDILVGAGNTEIRAGIIGEIGCSWPLPDREKKSLRASARAQERTGAAITIHPGRHEHSPMEIIRVLDDAGADIGRVIMGHIDRTGFLPATIQELAKTGCYLEYDIFGGNPFYPLHFGVFNRPCDRERIEQIIELIDKGYLEQILISQDTCLKSKLVHYGGQGYAHILRNILPQMLARGITEEHIKTIMVKNPSRFLCFVSSSEPE
ncbi:MAG: aryldialkylphosphatase [Thermodesulfobacteriota bacterium]